MSDPKVVQIEVHGQQYPIRTSLDPRYVQVAIERWEAFTGRKAERVDSLAERAGSEHARGRLRSG